MKTKHKAWAVGVPGDLLRRQGQLYPEIHDNRATARRVRKQILPFWPTCRVVRVQVTVEVI